MQEEKVFETTQSVRGHKDEKVNRDASEFIYDIAEGFYNKADLILSKAWVPILVLTGLYLTSHIVLGIINALGGVN